MPLSRTELQARATALGATLEFHDEAVLALGVHKASFVIRRNDILLSDTCTGADPRIADRSMCASVAVCLDHLDSMEVKFPSPSAGTSNTVSARVAELLDIPGCLILESNADGTIGMTAHGINHARANEMLSVGIHMNLSQHYAAIRDGAAGPGAKELQREIDISNSDRAAVTQ